MLFKLVRKWHFAASVVVGLGALALPAQGLAVRYASPAGSAVASCQTPATACSLKTAIQGNGGNVPTNGEEVTILTGSYPTETTEIQAGASNLNIHGEPGHPRPVINLTGIARLGLNTGMFSYLQIEQTAGSSEAVSSGFGATIDRVFMESTGNGGIPLCQCYLGVVRNSVLVAHGALQPALGVSSNGGNGNVTYRNVTAYSTTAAPAISLEQVGASGTITAHIFNSVALNAGGGPDVRSDGPNSTITFSKSNYRTTSTPQGGVIADVAGETHQTAVPLFANAAGGDFSELVNSPTIDAGLTNTANGSFDFAGNPRTVGGATDIGAYESQATAPTFALARKVKINRKGKGRLAFTCTSAAGEVCVVAATVGAGGKAKKRNLGRASGTVPAGSKGKILIKLKKTARKRLAAKGKLGARLSGSVTGASGLSTPLAAPLKLRPKH